MRTIISFGKNQLVFILIFNYFNFLSAQVSILYTAGAYPCNGKDLWEAAKKCPDKSCEEYKDALKIIEKECTGESERIVEEIIKIPSKA